jgi:hypothetical protein
MTQADRVHSTPPTNTSAINNSLPFAIAALSASLAVHLRRDAEMIRLRKQAADVVERLIAFLDASDDYTMDEREVDGDFEPGLGWTRGGATGGSLDVEEGFSHVGS